MTLTDRATVLGVGVALLIPGIIGLWRAATLRGDLFGKWNTRVDLAFNGLSEQAATELLKIQGIISELVGGAGTPFDPLNVVEDPSALREPMRRFQVILRVRDGLRPRFETLLSVGPILLPITAVYLIAVAVVTTYVARLHHLRGLTIACDYAGGVALLTMALTFATYAYLQHQLASAEIASQGHDGA